MLIDGIRMPAGAKIENSTFMSVTSFPASPTAGQVVYLSVANGNYAPGLYTYAGANGWLTGDITGVVAGAGLSGGGASGEVTLTVDTSTIATKAYADAGDSATLASANAYADAIKQGFDYKDSVRCATTANIVLSGVQTIDGVSTISGNRVLVKNQTTASTNGIYIVNAGTWTRALDANSSANVTTGMFVLVEVGTTNAGTSWVLTTDAVSLGTTALTFAQFGANSSPAQYYDLAGAVLGKPDAGAVVCVLPVIRSVTIPSSFTNSRAKSLTNATASATFTITKNGGAFGTFAFAAGQSTATFSGSAGSLVAGDYLTITAPSSQDATLANIGFAIAGTAA